MSDNPEALRLAQELQRTEATGIPLTVRGREVINELVAALAQQAATLTDAREYDQAIEALRRGLCALPRFSFLLDSAGNVRRVPDRSGNWIDFQAAHTLFDPVCVDALLAKTEAETALAKASQKESDRA